MSGYLANFRLCSGLPGPVAAVNDCKLKTFCSILPDATTIFYLDWRSWSIINSLLQLPSVKRVLVVILICNIPSYYCGLIASSASILYLQIASK